MEKLNPVQVVSETSINKYETLCADLIRRGYKLVSANCAAHGYESAITEVYQAVFVFPLAQAG